MDDAVAGRRVWAADELMMGPRSGRAWPYATGGVAVPGRPCILDTGVPWVRVDEEIAAQWPRLLAMGRRVLPGPDTVGPRRLTSTQKVAVGVFVAAMWTLRFGDVTPMTLRKAPVTGQAIRDELAACDRLLIPLEGSWAHATGVVSWLMWMTGASEKIAYSGLDGPP